jgi:hypothetical protein
MPSVFRTETPEVQNILYTCRNNIYFFNIVCILIPFFLFVLPDQRLYKVKFAPEQAQRGSRDIALLFFYPRR